MVKFRFNIFYFISIVCLFLLIGYVWFSILPLFSGYLEYNTVRSLAILVTALLGVSILAILLQMVEK